MVISQVSPKLEPSSNSNLDSDSPISHPFSLIDPHSLWKEVIFMEMKEEA